MTHDILPTVVYTINGNFSPCNQTVPQIQSNAFPLLAGGDGARLLLHGGLGLEDAALAAVTSAVDVAVRVGSFVGRGLHEGVATLGLVEAHKDEAGHDKDPVDVVADYGAVGGRIGPAKDGVEDTPGLTSGSLGTTTLRDCVSELGIKGRAARVLLTLTCQTLLSMS